MNHERVLKTFISSHRS